jgi:hypothetical protein
MRMRHLGRGLILAGTVFLIGSQSSLSATAQGPLCQFVLGFASVRDLVGADVVGECLADQRYAENGDAHQVTANGLLVWRKADNWTAFTDGYRTWLNGPFGLEQRLNLERFAWEQDPPSITLPAAVPAQATATPQVLPTPAPVPGTVSLSVLTQAVSGPQADGRGPVWVRGEVRNDSAHPVYAYTIGSAFTDQWGNTVARGEQRVNGINLWALALLPGDVLPYQVSAGQSYSLFPAYQRMSVAVEGTTRPPTTKAPTRSVAPAGLRYWFEEKGGATVAHIAGTTTNTSPRLWKHPTIIAWFLDGNGRVLDITHGAFGTTDVHLGAMVLRPGQPAPFDVTSTWIGDRTSLAKQVKTVKALAFVREEDVP